MKLATTILLAWQILQGVASSSACSQAIFNPIIKSKLHLCHKTPQTSSLPQCVPRNTAWLDTTSKTVLSDTYTTKVFIKELHIAVNDFKGEELGYQQLLHSSRSRDWHICGGDIQRDRLCHKELVCEKKGNLEEQSAVSTGREGTSGWHWCKHGTVIFLCKVLLSTKPQAGYINFFPPCQLQ